MCPECLEFAKEAVAKFQKSVAESGSPESAKFLMFRVTEMMVQFLERTSRESGGGG